MEQPNEKLNLPITHDACPACGSTEQLGITKIRELEDEGLIPKGVFSLGLVHQIPLVDQTKPPRIISQVQKIKILQIFWDVCGECGTMYCTKFDCAEGAAQFQMTGMPPQPRGPHHPPFMGKG